MVASDDGATREPGRMSETGSRDPELLAELEALREREEEAYETAARIAGAADARRLSLERMLHDGVLQHLTVLGLRLSALRSSDDEGVRTVVEQLEAELGHALADLRRLGHAIYPAVLGNGGLAAALGRTAEQFPGDLRIEIGSAQRYAATIEAAVYFCCLELLDDLAQRGGEERRVVIREVDVPGALVFEVEELGAGPAAPAVDGSRLQHAADRLTAIGGRLEVVDGEDARSYVRGTVPLVW